MAYEFELLDVITRDQLRTLQTRYAGSRMYIPRYPTEAHPIARLIGLQAAKKLSAQFAGHPILITRSLLVRQRNAAIRGERGWGLPPRVVAKRYGLTARTVRKICQGYELNNAKQPFGLRRRRLQAELQGLEWDDRDIAGKPKPTGRGA
jgi:hypothetical protein